MADNGLGLTSSNLRVFVPLAVPGTLTLICPVVG